MATPKKVFVSYKYSDVVEGRVDKFNFRDKLIDELDGRGLVHKGEDNESFDLKDYKRDQIISKIHPFVKNSSITVVFITPNAIKSQWIPWEISISLRKRTYDNEQNMTRNGIIGVYLPLDSNNIPVEFGGNYNFYKKLKSCGTITHFTSKFPNMIADNAFNLKNGAHTCGSGCCDSVYDSSTGSYIELVDWDTFIDDIDEYIDRAWKRREKFDNYNCRIKLNEGN